MSTLQSKLLGAGINPIAAQTWSAIISATIALLIQAQLKTLEALNWAEFCKARGSFGKPRTLGRFKGSRIPAEEGISGELLYFMQALRKEAAPNSILRKYEITFDGEARIRSRSKRGKNADRFDIRAYSNLIDGPELVFEAKVIEKESDIRASLLGDGGLKCFTKAEPYSRADVGFMLAYVVSGTPRLWVTAIQTGYTADPAICANAGVFDLTPGMPACTAIVAREGGLRPILMFNIALKFDTDPPTAS